MHRSIHSFSLLPHLYPYSLNWPLRTRIILSTFFDYIAPPIQSLSWLPTIYRKNIPLFLSVFQDFKIFLLAFQFSHSSHIRTIFIRYNYSGQTTQVLSVDFLCKHVSSFIINISPPQSNKREETMSIVFTVESWVT